MTFSRNLTLALFAGCVLTACGGPDSFPTKEQAKILEDGQTVLRKGNGAEPETLDPHRVQSVGASTILRDIYEGLVSKAPNGDLKPGGAASWDISGDGKTYTFTLRDNAVWSNGEPITAEDYAYGLRRVVNPATASPYAQILAPVVNANQIIQAQLPPSALGVKVLDKNHLRIQLNSPTPYFLALLTHASTYPAYRPAVEEFGDGFSLPEHSVTNGAYTLAEWVVGSHIRLKRNTRYWDNANTGVDQVDYLPITDVASELKRYQAGEIDWTASVPIPQLDQIREHIPDQLKTVPTLGVYYYGLNVTQPPLADAPELRRALSMSLDREVITEKITRGDEIPAYGWVPGVVDNYEGARMDFAEWPRDKRLAEARRLYKKAGYSKDQPLHLEIRYNTSESHKKLASVVANMWHVNLGVDTQLINEEWKVFLQNVRSKQVTQVFRAGWIGDYNDPYTFLELMYSKFGLNGSGYNNPEYDALLDQAAVLPNGEQRKKLMRSAEATLLADQPVIPIYFYTSKVLIKPYVQGFEGNGLGHYYSKDITVVPGR